MESQSASSSFPNGSNNNEDVVQALQQSIVVRNTNFDVRVKGDQLRLDLLYRWMRCGATTNSGRPDLTMAWFNRLCHMHSDDSRYYHTLMHLEEMFLTMDILLKAAAPPVQQEDEEAIVLATFFHDVIYNVHSATNEDDSAALFQQFVREMRAVGGTISQGLESLVVQSILATKKHSVSMDDPVPMQMVLDLDMAVLGKENSAYMSYAALIRQEYSYVDHDVYCQKRAAILEEFLQQPQIYASPPMFQALEQRARDNLQQEIECLRRGQIPSSNSDGNGVSSDGY